MSEQEEEGHLFSEQDLADIQVAVRSLKTMQSQLSESDNWVCDVTLRDANADIWAIVHWVDGSPVAELISADQRDRFTQLTNLIDQEVVK